MIELKNNFTFKRIAIYNDKDELPEEIWTTKVYKIDKLITTCKGGIMETEINITKRVTKRLEQEEGCLGLYKTQIPPIAKWLESGIYTHMNMAIKQLKLI